MPAFLKCLIPNSVRRAPIALLSKAEAAAAIEAINVRQEILNVKTAPLTEAIEMLQEPSQLRKAMKIFEECSNSYRNELYLSTDTNAARRLALHESLMATGYYNRAANMHNPKLDAVRFVVNHYNFDVRRDSALIDRCRRAVLSPDAVNSVDEGIAGEILQLERYLFGAQRLRPVEGQQFFMLGIPMAEFKDEKMLNAALDLAVIKAHGNFVVSHHDEIRGSYKGHVKRSPAMDTSRWMNACVTCGAEPEFDPSAPDTSAVFSKELMEFNRDTWLVRKFDYNLRYLLPAPVLPFWERVKMFLLNAWVYFFGGWVLFWMFDEELFAIISIGYTRYHSQKVLKEEAKRSGGRIYMMQSKYH